MKNLKAPEHLRKGQALFVFLNWLTKRVPEGGVMICYPCGTDIEHRLADPFSIPDDEFEALWGEWMASLPKGRP